MTNTTSAFAHTLLSSLDSPFARLLMAAAWAGAAGLWVLVSARLRPANSSFGWRALSLAALVCCGAQCATNVLLWAGDRDTAFVIDFVSRLVAVAGAVGIGARIVATARARIHLAGVEHWVEDATTRHAAASYETKG